MACTTEELTGPLDGRPGCHAFVGPCSNGRHAAAAPFAWNRHDHRRPLVVVTLETPHWHRGARLYARAAQAVASLDVQA